jgi:hypothetical protein
MSFIRGGETITIQRRTAGAVDEFGNKTYTTTNITVRDVLIGVGTTDEPVDAIRRAVDASLTLYLPAGTQILDGDVFVIRNSLWVKDGRAGEFSNPFGGSFEGGIVVPLRRRDG